jgi:hypothetical protein
VPIDGEKRTKVTLICQTDLRNWIPKWASYANFLLDFQSSNSDVMKAQLCSDECAVVQ